MNGKRILVALAAAVLVYSCASGPPPQPDTPTFERAAFLTLEDLSDLPLPESTSNEIMQSADGGFQSRVTNRETGSMDANIRWSLDSRRPIGRDCSQCDSSTRQEQLYSMNSLSTDSASGVEDA